MLILLREVIHSDGTKSKLLIINHPNGAIGSVKIQVKQWKQFKAIGIKSDQVIIDKQGNATTTDKIHLFKH